MTATKYDGRAIAERSEKVARNLFRSIGLDFEKVSTGRKAENQVHSEHEGATAAVFH